MGGQEEKKKESMKNRTLGLPQKAVAYANSHVTKLRLNYRFDSSTDGIVNWSTRSCLISTSEMGSLPSPTGKLLPNNCFFA